MWGRTEQGNIGKAERDNVRKDRAGQYREGQSGAMWGRTERGTIGKDRAGQCGEGQSGAM